MKIGDLVTLSEAALNLAPLWIYSNRVRAGGVVGMVIDISEGSLDNLRHRYFKDSKYKVFWFDPELQKKPLKRQPWMSRAVWKRADLKKYRSPKKK